MKTLATLCAALISAHAAAEVRPTAVAGSFYPKDPVELRAEVTDLLAEAATTGGGGTARALIVPHAGYVFSGSTAARAFVRLPSEGVKRIILLGPSHSFAFRGAALPAEKLKAFETPLGPVALDLEVIKALRGESLFDGPPEAHEREHSLEVELPFLRLVAPDATLVPVLLGTNTDLAGCVAVAKALAGFLDRSTVVIASSDFTHHGDRYGWTPYDGKKLGETLLGVGRETAERAAAPDLRGFLRQVEVSGDTVCGVRPVAVLDALLEHAFDGDGEVLEVTTSGHVTGSFDLSVTYVAAAFSGSWESWTDQQAANLDELNAKDGAALVSLARATLTGGLTHDTSVARWFAGHEDHARWLDLAGAFVTLNNKGAKARAEGKLRACMGLVEARQPLIDAVVIASVMASRDPRFPPLTAEELEEVEVEVSVLSPMRRVASHRFIEPGVHGVLLEKNGKQALYLPQVATEQGWSKEEMLDHLALKAGLQRKDWEHGARFQVFTAQVFSEGH